MSDIVPKNQTEQAPPELAETGVDWAAVLVQFVLVAMLGGVLWVYKDAPWSTLTPALTAVVVALVSSRLDRIRKLTSKLVSFETQPVVQRADAATKRANQASDEAKAMAGRAHEAATAAAEAARAATMMVTETREQLGHLERVTDEARRVTVELLGSELSQLQVHGGHTWETVEELAETLRHFEGRLRAMGASAREFRAATATLRGRLLSQIGIRLTNRALELRAGLPSEQAEAVNREATEIRKAAVAAEREPSPEEYEAFFAKHGWSEDADVKVRLALFRTVWSPYAKSPVT